MFKIRQAQTDRFDSKLEQEHNNKIAAEIRKLLPESENIGDEKLRLLIKEARFEADKLGIYSEANTAQLTALSVASKEPVWKNLEFVEHIKSSDEPRQEFDRLIDILAEE